MRPTMSGFGPILLLVLVGYFAVLPRPSVALSYEGYQMYSVEVKTMKEVDNLINIIEQFDGVTTMNEPRYGKITLAVPTAMVSLLRSAFTDLNMEMTLVYNDIQRLIDATTKRPEGGIDKRSMVSTDTSVVDHEKYHRYPEIVSMLHHLASRNSDIMDVSTLVYRTHEGNQVICVKLHGNSSTSGSGASTKPAIVIESGIHAREWITPAVQLWLIENMLQGYRTGDPTVTTMLDTFDWYIIPVTNPDGYDYSHAVDRLWRKNRRYISYECRGVDLNRNFDVKFNTTGVSQNCRSNIYLGFKPFSEPETSNVKELVTSLRSRLVAYLAIHSYSQLILIPWGYSEEPMFPDNYDYLDHIAELMTVAISARHGVTFLKGQAYPLLGNAASGAGEDWALKEVPGIFATCIELRPSGDDVRGFLLPPDEIVPSAEEYFDSLVVMAMELAKQARDKNSSN
ncbi:hypothetical protein EGW08_014067 [Elysia chlorotica]|uniref:Peptidase M14 domain-containing protein n=1 Tax=Elysia chlorotica TaxID=188477 RepID=A0A3S0ZG83_ELYCH|nr:hypothetical protein EGW08_014067 [Elysia chlorotica]